MVADVGMNLRHVDSLILKGGVSKLSRVGPKIGLAKIFSHGLVCVHGVMPKRVLQTGSLFQLSGLYAERKGKGIKSGVFSSPPVIG